jgi:hypothetical protein
MSETAQANNDYLDLRKRCKEQISDKSPLIRAADSRSKPIWGWSDGGEWSTQVAKCIRPSNTKE